MKIAKAILLTILLVLLEMGIQLLFYLIFDTVISSKHGGHVLGTALVTARIVAYSTIFYFFWKPHLKKNLFRPKKIDLFIILLLLLITLGTEFINRPFADLDRIFSHTPANFSFNGFSTYRIYTSITALFIAPVLEETFFRKFLLRKLLQENGFLMALFTTSLLFSLIHWETPLNLIPAFLFGIISGIIYLKTGRIIYSMLLHFLYNAFGLMLFIYADLHANWLNWLNFGIIYWSLFIFGIILTLVALKLIPSVKTKRFSEI
ncbi:lysostaphin resistance A-like protein [Salinimicrobium sp. GXAS 041]|uniref:CPBP family intramembrane glutamic endopeptidase n=1 Tax=Salinimicrobium sp. GXAS 041 TaxID=3400806 RepID=UPI003C71F101